MIIIVIINCFLILISQVQSIFTSVKFDADFNMTWWQGGPVKIMGEAYQNQGKCDFNAVECLIELPEHYLVRNYIKKDSVVLEFGARYGTTSCEIASKVGSNGHVISIDPDERSWEPFMLNIKQHNCNVHFVKGVVGDHGVRISSRLSRVYGTQTVETTNLTEQVGNVYSIAEIESSIGKEVDTLLIDCEGCVDRILNHFRHKMYNIKMIIMEADMSLKELGKKSKVAVDYNKIINKLEYFGFKAIRLLEDCGINSLNDLINEYKIDIPYWNKHCIKNMDHYVFINLNSTLNHEMILKYQTSLIPKV